MKKLILISILSLFSCKKMDEKPIDKQRYPDEVPIVYYNYDEEGYVTQFVDKCDLNKYKGKIVKDVETKNTDVIIHFTDGTYIYLKIYKYTPQLVFFKK